MIPICRLQKSYMYFLPGQGSEVRTGCLGPRTHPGRDTATRWKKEGGVSGQVKGRRSSSADELWQGTECQLIRHDLPPLQSCIRKEAFVRMWPGGTLASPGPRERRSSQGGGPWGKNYCEPANRPISVDAPLLD